MSIKFKAVHVGLMTADKWQHDKWIIYIYDHAFDYMTGIGHRKLLPNTKIDTVYGLENSKPVKPTIDQVLESLFLDASCGSNSFEEFCSNGGYDTDSRKALDIYLKCQSNDALLRKALGHELYNSEKKRLEDK
jgi:hypothetical protein